MLGSRCRRLSGLQAHPVSALTLRARCSARRLAVAVTQLLCISAHAHAAVTHISLVYVDAEHVVARLLEAKGGADAEAANTEQRHLSHHSSACVAASVIVHPHAFRAPKAQSWVVEDEARCAARGAGDRAAYLLARTVAAGHTAAAKVAANHRKPLALFRARHRRPLGAGLRYEWLIQICWICWYKFFLLSTGGNRRHGGTGGV